MYHEGQMEVLASVDRITILGKTKNKLLWSEQLRRRETVVKELMAPFPYRTGFVTIDGAYIAVTGGDETDIPQVRIDFNPNSLSENGRRELHEIIEYPICKLRSLRLSRIDVAIDYYGRDMCQMEWHEKVERRRRTFQTADGKLETLYLGSPSSDKQIRIYDKAKEQKMEGLWWRVESQVRMSKGDKLFKENPFEGLYAYEKGSEFGGLSIEEKATLQYLEEHPTAIGQMTKRMKQKYRSLMAEVEQKLEPTPRDVFENEKGNLLQQIAEWLNADKKNN